MSKYIQLGLIALINVPLLALMISCFQRTAYYAVTSPELNVARHDFCLLIGILSLVLLIVVDAGLVLIEFLKIQNKFKKNFYR
jgi:uncharacterized membrane protein